MKTSLKCCILQFKKPNQPNIKPSFIFNFYRESAKMKFLVLAAVACVMMASSEATSASICSNPGKGLFTNDVTPFLSIFDIHTHAYTLVCLRSLLIEIKFSRYRKNKTGLKPVSMTCGTGSLFWRVS